MDDGDAGTETPRWGLPSLLVLPALALTAVVFAPVTRNYFFSDDFLNLYFITTHPLLEYLVTPNGGHVLLTRNAIFYATARLFGADPEPYFWCALLTHLVNVWLLFGVIRRLTQSARLASLGAALWGISPFNEGTLGWYSVYGHVLVGTALLVILYQATGAALAARAPSRAQRVLWYALALAAATSFGTGTAIAIILPIVLHLLLGSRGGIRSLARAPLISLVVVVPVLYLTLYTAYGAISGLSPTVRSPLALLTRPAAIVLYFGHLIAVGLTNLLLGVYAASLTDPPAWYAVLGCFVVVSVAVARRAGPETARRLAACAVLLFACYATVAFARTLFLANAPTNLLPVLTRYHYVGQLVMTIALCLLLSALAPNRVRTLALVAWYGLAIFGQARFGRAIDHHLKARENTDAVRAEIRKAIAAPPRGPIVYIPNRRFVPVPLPMSMFPGWAAVFMIFYPTDTVGGRRIYFVDPNPDTLAAMERHPRTRNLVIPARPPQEKSAATPSGRAGPP